MSTSEANSSRTTVRCGNFLLDRLPLVQRRKAIADCDTVELPAGRVLCEAGQAFDYAYFPVSGNISVTQAVVGHRPFETENIGCEGMLGVSLILGMNRAPQDALVGTACQALRMESHRFSRALDEYPALLQVLQRYLYTVLEDLSLTAGCVRFHDVGSRLARGLLLAHDRVQSDVLPLLTHRLLADMLGVQRGSVTISAAKLQRAGIIRYSRGRIAILDRPGLEAASCGCYRGSAENQNRSVT